MRRSRCASTNEQLAAMMDEMADLTRLRARVTSPIISAGGRLSANGDAHQSTTPARRGQGIASAPDSAGNVGRRRRSRPSTPASISTKTNVNGFTFQELPTKPSKVRARRAFSLSGGGDSQHSYGLRPRLYKNKRNTFSNLKGCANQEHDTTKRLMSRRQSRLLSVSSDDNNSDDQPLQQTEYLAPYVPLQKNTAIVCGKCRLCGSRPHIKQVRTYTMEAVRELVLGVSGPELATTLYREEIDGRCLLMLERFDHFPLRGVKLGPYLRLLDYLQSLR